MDDRRAWPWAAAAAALVVVTLMLRAGAGAMAAGVYTAPVDAERAAVENLVAALGGDSDARVIAEAIAMQERVRDARQPVAPREGDR